MDESDDRPFHPGDPGAAALLLTRVPVPPRWVAPARGARAAWAWPLIGGVVALAAIGAGAIALTLGLPPAAAAGLILATQIALTGGLHEDGLADTADGLWGGQTRARRLEIMRDSRIGSYGVLALILSLGLRWAAIAALLTAGWLWPVVAAALLSRAGMAAVMAALPPARPDGLSLGTGRPPRITVTAACLVALAGALLCTGPAALVAACVGAAGAAVLTAIAQARLSGQTGDLLGASQQLAEIGALMTFTALV